MSFNSIAPLRGLHRFRSGANHVEHKFGLRKHWHMAAIGLIGGCAHALGKETFQIGMNRAVFFADDLPAGL